jgi:hypothetical protein
LFALRWAAEGSTALREVVFGVCREYAPRRRAQNAEGAEAVTADVAPLTPEELAEARKRHYCVWCYENVHGILGIGITEHRCLCSKGWPCDAARAIATVDAPEFVWCEDCGGYIEVVDAP